MQLEELVNKIINTPQFLYLKEIEEIGPYHDHEDVYSHSLKTHRIAKEAATGEFITLGPAKKAYLEFLNEEFEGIKRADILTLIALLHDFGKSLYFEEDGKKESILSVKPNGDTQCSNHEYWGSVFIKDFLKQFNLPNEVIEYISNCIRLHDTFNDSYFKVKVDWPIEVIIKDLKSRADGLYKEVLFNIYCDCYNAEIPFGFAKKMIEQIFSNPKFYTPRNYTTS